MEIELPPGADFGVEASGENNQTGRLSSALLGRARKTLRL